MSFRYGLPGGITPSTGVVNAIEGGGDGLCATRPTQAVTTAVLEACAKAKEIIMDAESCRGDERGM